MKLRLATLALAGLCSASPLWANDWYQWRGPEQDGVSRENHLPSKWSPDGENLAWSAPVGGMSCPIVMDGYLYTFTRVGEVPAGEGFTATVDPGPKTQEALTCVDAKTGRIVWQHLQNMFQTDAPFHRLGWSSPVGDPQTGRVYAMGTQCTLVCCDAKTGKLIWDHQMTEEYGMISTFGGRTASPAIDGDLLFVTGVSFGWGDHAGSQHRIFAFDKNTGKLVWTSGTGGIPVDAPYNTPVVGVIGGQKLVIFPGGDGGIHAFQARTGKKVWTWHASKHGMNSSCLIKGNLVYASWDLDNFDSNRLGGVACLDGSKVEEGSPKLVWKREGIEDGFPTMTLAEGTVYALTDSAQLYALDAKTGAIKYHHGMGTIGKASLVWGDGKLYVAEANGRFSIVRPEADRFRILSRADFMDKPGREYVIFGSPAISDGHVFLSTATTLYCIGSKEFEPRHVDVPPAPQEEPAASDDKPALLQVVPADLVLHPGEKATFTVRAFDAMGRPVADVKPDKWEVGKLVMPAPPARPNGLMRTNSAVAARGGTSSAPKPEAAAPPSPPPAGPTLAGNLLGTVDDSGTFTAAPDPTHVLEGGGVIAQAGGLRGVGRVRVFPSLPWKADFEKAVVGKPPLTWIGAGMKFAVRQDPNDPTNKVLVKLTDIPLFARARTYMGYREMSDYTIQADVQATETVYDDNGQEVHKMPDIGVINSRYCLELKGSDQTLNLYGWGAAIPRNELLPGLATHRAIPFTWKAGVWYVEKLMVEQESGKAVLKGKVWPRGQAEPAEWTIDLEDPTPNTHGAAGLWGFSNDQEIYYDNIVVTPNQSTTVVRAASPASGNDDWRMWGRTPMRNMVSPDRNPPTDWNIKTGKNILWSASLGSKSYGNPVICQGMVFVGTNNEGHRDPNNTADGGVLMAFNAMNGNFLWQRYSAKLPTGRVNDWPGEGECATVYTEPGRLWYCTNRCEVVCLDTGAGASHPGVEPRVIWSFDMINRLGVFPHNMTASAICAWHDYIYAITGNGVDDTHKHVVAPMAPSIVCFNKNTGKVVWTDNHPGPNVLHGQWSSVAIVEVRGRPLVIAPLGDAWVYAFDARTGEIVWKFDMNPKSAVYPQTRNEVIASPCIVVDKQDPEKKYMYIGSGQDPEHGEGLGHLYCVDITREGDISKELEVDERPEGVIGNGPVDIRGEARKGKPNPNSGIVWEYESYDLNHDGKIDRSEHMNRTISTCLVTQAGLVFAPDFSGFLHCLDAKTGQVYWTYDMESAMWGSCMWADGKVFVTDEDGDVRIFADSKEMKKLSPDDDHLNLGSASYCSPVFADGNLYISDRDSLYAIRNGAQSKPKADSDQ